MRKYLILLVVLFMIPSLLAINIDVEKHSSEETMILGLDSPATFDLSITNEGKTDSFIIYTFFGAGYTPKGKFTIRANNTKNIDFIINTPSVVQKTGLNRFDYFIRGSDNSEYEGEFTAIVKELGESFKIGANQIDPKSNSLEIYIENTENFNFEDLDVKFSSAFFEIEKKFSLLKKES